MTYSFRAAQIRTFVGGASLALILVLTATRGAEAAPSLIVDVASGTVLEAQDATKPWYPASITKLMSMYVAFQALQAGRVTLDTPFLVSARAAAMPPSKLGFAPGSEVTLDNLMKMMMVKSANDLAVTLAEGVSGSVEAFAGEMNAAAKKLGLHESHFANPNGLPDSTHYSSARDLAIVARALLLEFPQYSGYFDIGAFDLGGQITPTHNDLMGRYPGIDGMKTGFTCAAGFNVVATSDRGGRKLMVVVLGSPSVRLRSMKAAALLDAGFSGKLPSVGDLNSLPSVGGSPPDMHQSTCTRRKRMIAVDDLPANVVNASVATAGANLLSGLFQSQTPPPAAAQIQFNVEPAYQPVPVYVGPAPNWAGPVVGPVNIAKTVPTATPAAVSATAALPAVTAYAPDKGDAIDTSGSPVAPDPNALPLNLSGAAKHRTASVGEAATKAIALAAKTPVKTKVGASRAVSAGKLKKTKDAASE